MSGSEDEAADRAARYAEARGVAIEKRLGFGYDGIVFATSRHGIHLADVRPGNIRFADDTGE